MEILKKLYREENGQTATEYMVLLASVVAAILGAAYAFSGKFGSGVNSLGSHVKSNLEAGFTGGSGGSAGAKN
jgi:Flp pilus assembly pilin Flp